MSFFNSNIRNTKNGISTKVLQLVACDIADHLAYIIYLVPYIETGPRPTHFKKAKEVPLKVTSKK